jgi:methionine-rich copper-binding protein CopC
MRLIAVAGACALLAFPAGASAHTGIESYSPRPGSTASRDRTYVKATFVARVSAANLRVTRNGAKVSRGDGSLVHKGRQVRARLTSHRRGRYSATARWLSSDGHVQSKTWSFRLR